MDKRFVIHQHKGYGQDHYDLMLEEPQALATWQFADEPWSVEISRCLQARRLDNHRLAYLDYQGPVSGGRGSVRIADAGTYRTVLQDQQRWVADFAGANMHGRYELARIDETTWALKRIS